MSRGDLPREGCRERAAERGQESLYHHPEATEGGELKGTRGRSGWGRKISPTKAFTQSGSKQDATVFFVFFRMCFYSLNNGMNGIACCPTELQSTAQCNLIT